MTSRPDSPLTEQSFSSTSVADTLSIAADFARELKASDVVCLYGDLGAGKTHFVKGIARYLGLPEEQVQSPTFSLIHEYGGNPPLYHFDMYRLESLEQALEIGVEDYLYDAGICVVEWPERIESLLPSSYWMVQIKQLSPNARSIRIGRAS